MWSKCCDGQCPPCYAICKKTLSCGNHKCESVCHRGPCYPCQQTVLLTCSNCGNPLTRVPCGVKKNKFKCNQLCKYPSECAHINRHGCHFGPCPPCRQICNKVKPCGHACPQICHSKVVVCTDPNFKPATPLDLPPLEVMSLDCPECEVPVEVPCLGGHEKLRLPCYRAVTQSCGKACGRLLACHNHLCTQSCHTVSNVSNGKDAGPECEICSEECAAERMCTHPCTLGCHPPPCPKCKISLKLRCHCALNLIFVKCFEWIIMDESERQEKLSCGDQCPKLYPCGHRCSSNCHPGDCPNSNLCKKKVKLTCPCKRIKKEFSCHLSKDQQILCDATCEAQKKERELKRLQEKEGEHLAEELRNKKESEMFEKKLDGGKRQRRKRTKRLQEKEGEHLAEELRNIKESEMFEKKLHGGKRQRRKRTKRLQEKEGEHLAEELRNKKELEMFEKKLHGGKRQRRKRTVQEEEKPSLLSQYKYYIVGAAVVATFVGFFFLGRSSSRN